MVQVHNENEDCMKKVQSIDFPFNKYKFLIEDLTKGKEKFAVCKLKVINLKRYCSWFESEYGHAIIYHVYMELKKYIDKTGKVFKTYDNILLLILWNFNNQKEIEKFVEEFFTKFEKPCNIMNDKIKVQINMGIAMYPENSQDIEVLLRYADIALNRCRLISNKRYEVFNFNMYLEALMEEVAEIDILNALTDKEFILHYQPQVNLYTGEIYGLEALMRWNHPLYGLLPSFLFIDTLIENGTINEVGKWVIEEACNQNRIWTQLGYENMILSVNVSIGQLEDEKFFLFVQDLLEIFKIKASCLNIEITGYEKYKFQTTVIDNLNKLRGLGIKVYLDNFGTSYCYLNNLCILPVDGIKIDKFFIDDIDINNKKFIITKKTIELASELGIDVVAEGVERKEQIDCLKEIDCHKAQGYFFSEPMAPNEIIDILKKNNKKRSII